MEKNIAINKSLLKFKGYNISYEELNSSKEPGIKIYCYVSQHVGYCYYFKSLYMDNTASENVTME